MTHMLLIVEPVGQRAERGLEGGREAYAQMMAFGERLKQRGVLVSSASLASTTDAVRLQVRDGQRSVVDGPFAEAKEMVGGYFLIECETDDEAQAIAAECPAAAWCTVEVRKLAPCFA